MPTVTAYKNGVTAGIGGGNPSPKKRSTVKGWSPAAVRRHTSWLYGVDAPALDGDGFALTLTMRHTPDTAAAFHALRRAWIMRVTRMGASRIHWVIEWQRRGTPHLHCAVYFPPGETPQYAEARMITAWTEIADDFGAAIPGQHYDHISGALGWLQYLSKHASRGVKHYQRSGHPSGWDKTGRLWGHTGEWPTDAPMRFDMSREAYWRYRRLVRAWRVADARKSGDSSRIKYARSMLACPLPKLSAVRGVSDWVTEDVSLTLIDLLVRDGHTIIQRAE